jgi:CspA family cold shock protein
VEPEHPAGAGRGQWVDEAAERVHVVHPCQQGDPGAPPGIVGQPAGLSVQGVIRSFDPATRTGSVISDTSLTEHELAADALEGSLFRMLRQGQRVVFDLDPAGFATHVRLGSEVDMGTPGFDPLPRDN